ncbi:MAG: glycosyltransferase family 39 protein [Acidobacteria bacterium]|nr:glycosyltransferase family 39 protein [Acidobacteriota bacterium]
MPPIRLLFALLITAVSVLNVTRSVRQSLTIDEAMTFLSFSSKPLGEMFVYYDANNHVLFTLLSRASFLALGDAEWAIRLPAVVAGVAFLVLLARVLVRLLGENGMAVAAWVAVGSNPLLLDHLVAGRGYGLALALWMGALWVLLDGGEAGGWGRWAGAGVLLGLALAANLNLLYAGVATGLTYALLRGRRGAQAALVMAGATLLTAAPILYPALRHATRDNFYYGAESWSHCVDQFVWLAMMPVHGDWNLGAMLAGQTRLLPWLVGAVALSGPLLWRRRQALLVALPVVLALGLTEAAHRWAGVRYPLGRTALPLFVLTLLAMAALATVPRVRYGVVVVFVLLTGSHLAASRWSYFGEWPGDGESRELARVAAGQEGPMCATWTLLPALEYYRLRYRLPAPEMVLNERGPGCVWFFAARADRQWPEENGFVAVAAGAQSKVKVYRNPGL